MIGVLFCSWRRKENPGTDNLTSVGSSIRNAAPENLGIFNVLFKCQILQRWWTHRLCSKCKELLLILKLWAVVLSAEIAPLLNLLDAFSASLISIVHNDCSVH